MQISLPLDSMLFSMFILYLTWYDISLIWADNEMSLSLDSMLFFYSYIVIDTADNANFIAFGFYAFFNVYSVLDLV